MKREITWKNEKWIVDYETGTIYKKTSLSADDPNLLTVQTRLGDYQFKEFKGSIYFQDSNNFYKINDGKVDMISKDEYERQTKFIKLNAKNRANVTFISTYVSSIIIDELLSAKYGITISTKVRNSNVVPIISDDFPSFIKGKINNISKFIILTLPYVDRTNIKEEVKKALFSWFDGDTESLSQIINAIYENDRIRFDEIANDIKTQIAERKQRRNANVSDSSNFGTNDVLTQTPDEETVERRKK